MAYFVSWYLLVCLCVIRHVEVKGKLSTALLYESFDNKRPCCLHPGSKCLNFYQIYLGFTYRIGLACSLRILLHVSRIRDTLQAIQCSVSKGFGI